eukprot:gene17188-20480_t
MNSILFITILVAALFTAQSFGNTLSVDATSGCGSLLQDMNQVVPDGATVNMCVLSSNGPATATYNAVITANSGDIVVKYGSYRIPSQAGKCPTNLSDMLQVQKTINGDVDGQIVIVTSQSGYQTGMTVTCDNGDGSDCNINFSGTYCVVEGVNSASTLAFGVTSVVMTAAASVLLF